MALPTVDWCVTVNAVNRVMVVVDPDVGMSAAQVAAAWNEDPAGAGHGQALVEPTRGQVFLPGLVEWVVLPVAVNLLSSGIYDLLKRLIARDRPARQVDEVELVEVSSPGGDRVVVVRRRRETR